jgi:hypothetical protein
MHCKEPPELSGLEVGISTSNSRIGFSTPPGPQDASNEANNTMGVTSFIVLFILDFI